MAKSNPTPPVQFTHEQLLSLLNEAWTTQFIARARFELRQKSEPFFGAAVLVTSPTQDLSALVPLVPAFRELLRDHQADIAGDRVRLADPKPIPDWYSTFRTYPTGLFKPLRAHPTPTFAHEAPATMPHHPAPSPAISVVDDAQASAPTTGPSGHPSSKVTGSTHGGSHVDDVPESGSRKVQPNEATLRPPASDNVTVATSGQCTPAARANVDVLDWPLPGRLTEARGPGFPREALSPWLRAFVQELAEQTQIQVDVPAVWSLGALGAAAAKGVTVEVQRGDQHPTNLWLAAVMPSGAGKSPTLQEIRRPFDDMQLELRTAAREARARRETGLRVAKMRLRRLERNAADAEDAEERETLLEGCASLQTEIFQLERPAIPTLTTGDPTRASLTQLMGENDGKLLLLTDEGDGFFNGLGSGEGIEAMLQAHSGVTIERTRSARHEIRVVSPSLSMIMGIQPAPFARVMGTRAFHDKGLLARFLFIVPEVQNGARKQVRQGIQDSTRQGYERRVRSLSALTATPIKLSLAVPAFDAFAAFAARVDSALTDGGLLDLKEWANKLRSVTARVAGVLHAADHVLSEKIPAEIGVEAMERAIHIAEYFEAHALVAYGDAIRSAQDEGAKKVWRWIADSGLATFRQAEAVRALNGRLASAEVAEALERLVDDGYLRIMSSRRTTAGRPAKATYRVHPLLVKRTEKTEKGE